MNSYLKKMGKRSGFTLIEVLISLTLLVIVLGAVYSTFFSVLRALERFENVSLKYHEVRTTLDMIRREIESSIMKDPGSDQENAVKSDFIIKDRDYLGRNASTLSLTSMSFKGSSLNAISYMVKKKEDGSLSLIKDETASVMEKDSYEVELIEGIEGFTVETLFNGKWVKTWDTDLTGRLPDEVRVSIEFSDKGKKVELKEYARPRVGDRL